MADYVVETFETVMNRLLSRVDDSMDKREGSIIYDALAPAAVEIVNMEVEIATVYKQTSAATATGEYLDLKVSERSLTRTPASYAKVQGSFSPSGLIGLGDRFSCGEYNYAVDDADAETLICETAGTLPNGVTGTLIPIDYIKGLETSEITQVLIPAEDTESDDDLRARYYDNLNNKSYGGNVAEYKEWCNSISGVVGTKVIPVWNGGGTVKCVIIDSEYATPSEALVEEVQTTIDPETNQGEGLGLAPIDHTVTIEGVASTTINLTCTVTYESGWDYTSAESYIKAALDDYFLGLAKTWADTDTLVVRISGIEMALLSASGILDVADTTINDTAANLHLDEYAIPVRGTFNGNGA